MILTADRLAMLQHHGLSAITLSVDGTESSHRYLRRHKESWNRVLSALDLLGHSSVPFADVVTCVWPDNLKTLSQTADLLISKGMKRWRIFRIFPKGAAAEKPELMLTFEQSRELINWIAEHRPGYLKRGLDMQFSCEGYVPFELDRKIRQEPFFCRAGISIGAILADGSVTGCNNNGPDFHQGSILNDSFRSIWENRFDEYRCDSWKKTGVCSSCKDWNACRGGSIHLREKGNPNPLFCYQCEIPG